MPLAQSWIELEQTIGRPVLKGTYDEIKEGAKGLSALLRSQVPAPSDNVSVQDRKIEGIGCRVYTLKAASDPRPMGIWMHAGGFMIGDLDLEDWMCRQTCERTMSTIVSVDYSLSPEFKWPTQYNEAFTVYKWAHDNASLIGGDATKMYTIGSSCGAQLALNLCDRVLRDPLLKDSIKGVAALSPATFPPNSCPDKYKSRATAFREFKQDNPIVDGESMEIFLQAIGQKEDDPDFWVLLATDNHKNFPPVYLASCEYDPLRDDTQFLLETLGEVGVPTRHDIYPGLPHYFWVFPNLPDTPGFVDNPAGGIKWLKSRM